MGEEGPEPSLTWTIPIVATVFFFLSCIPNPLLPKPQGDLLLNFFLILNFSFGTEA